MENNIFQMDVCEDDFGLSLLCKLDGSKGFIMSHFTRTLWWGSHWKEMVPRARLVREPMCLEIVEGLDDQNRLGCIWDTMGYISCKHVHNIYIWRKPWFLFKIPSCDVRVQES